jgi:hypothetical protein
MRHTSAFRGDVRSTPSSAIWAVSASVSRRQIVGGSIPVSGYGYNETLALFRVPSGAVLEQLLPISRR